MQKKFLTPILSENAVIQEQKGPSLFWSRQPVKTNIILNTERLNAFPLKISNKQVQVTIYLFTWALTLPS